MPADTHTSIWFAQCFFICRTEKAKNKMWRKIYEDCSIKLDELQAVSLTQSTPARLFAFSFSENTMKSNTIILWQCLSEFRFECVWMCMCLCCSVLLANFLSFSNSYLTQTHIPICFYRTFNPLKNICNIWFYIWFFGSLFWIWMYLALAIHCTRNWKMHAQTPAFEWTFSNSHPQIYWMLKYYFGRKTKNMQVKWLNTKAFVLNQ